MTVTYIVVGRTFRSGSPDYATTAAVLRQIDHYSFHIGQINIIARQLVGTDIWKWFTLAPGATKAFNKKLMGE